MRFTRRTVLAGLALPSVAAVAQGRRGLILSAPDGVPVSALAYGAGRRAVVLVPGGHGVGETWDGQARRLARSGFAVLAIDYRGRGARADVPPDDEKAHLDVLAAVQHLRREGAREVSVVGASWGGWAAGTAAITEPGLIDRLVLLAHSPFEQPERLGGRKLFVVAAQDRVGTGKLRLDSIREQYERVPAPKALVVLEGAAHAQFLFLTPQGDRLHSEIARFLSAD